READLPSSPGLEVAKIIELEAKDPLKGPDIALHRADQGARAVASELCRSSMLVE
ncbi:hypothetical protein FRC09_011312, partial [Ceratobasidium sp. 395]